MANGVQRKKRPEQKGVQAIFTPDGDRKGKALAIIGLLLIGMGAAVWIWTIQGVRGATEGAVFQEVSLSLLSFSLAMVLVIGGAGLNTYSLAIRRTRQENYRMVSSIYKLDELVGPKNVVSNPPPITETDAKVLEEQASPRRISKTLAVALVEGVMVIILYLGLVSEYKSNIHMQEWVRANIFLGDYLLNDLALLPLTATLSGVLIFQLWPRRTESKAIR